MIAVSGDKFVDQARRDYIEVGKDRGFDLSDDRHRCANEPLDLSRLDRGRNGHRRDGDPEAARKRAKCCHAVSGQRPSRSHANTCGALA